MNKYIVLVRDVTGNSCSLYARNELPTLEDCYKYLDNIKTDQPSHYVFIAEILKIIDNEYRLMIENPYT